MGNAGRDRPCTSRLAIDGFIGWAGRCVRRQIQTGATTIAG
jgi:hypothetical protein